MAATLELLSLARAPSSELSNDVADTFSHVASMSSTPPTTLTDGMSTTSESSKQEHLLLSDPIEPSLLRHSDPDASLSIPLPLDPLASLESDTVTEAIEAIEAIANAPDSPIAKPAPASPSPAPGTVDAAVSSETPSTRSRRSRQSLPIYNLVKLSGTANHGKRRADGDALGERQRRASAGDALAEDGRFANSTDAKQADSPKSRTTKKRAASPEPAKRATRSTGLQVENLAQKVSSLGKRSRKSFEQSVAKMSREMRRLQDTNEFAGIDTKPVLFTTWAKGKFVEPEAPGPARKKTKVPESPKKSTAEKEIAETMPEIPNTRLRRVKKYLTHGLYSGQSQPLDITKHLTPNEKRIVTERPELLPNGKPNKVLPMPMFSGLRLLIQGRNFVLPFDVCNPLPPGQPKPATWRLMTRNRFIGNAGVMWKKSPHFKDYQSKCVCTPEDGCTESCQNRIMLYECDKTNCNAGAAYCQNRAFARLQERIKAGGKFRVGVEVCKTEDRGFGIRTNRCFKPGQIIMEYTGEIINEEECERRMEEEYKDNECYYLMSFDQNMIIDATTGSIARFVNHSCQPNCRMIKWIVSGQPRMALFAGDRPIMTGEELTYDYNFDPFSAKNVQKCLCGAPNCRGVLGPKPKEAKPPKPTKEELKKAMKKGVKAGKRKLKELLGDKDGSDDKIVKKRKIKAATGTKGIKAVKATKAIKSTKATKAVKAVKSPKAVKSTKGGKADPKKRTLSKAGVKKAAQGAAKVVKKSVSSISVKTPASGRKITVKHKSSMVKTYGKTKLAKGISKGITKATKKSTSSKSKYTIVAAGDFENVKPGKKSSPSTKKTKGSASKTDVNHVPKKRGRPRKHPLPVPPQTGHALADISNQIQVVQPPTLEVAT